MPVSYVGVGPARDQTIVTAARRLTRARPRRRRWRARARPGLGLARSPLGRRGRRRARQPGDRRARPPAIPLDVADPAAVAALADGSTPAWWWSAPRSRWWRAPSTPARPPGGPPSDPRPPAARLEGSKAWMKEVLADAGVPTARTATSTAGDEEAALRLPRVARRPLRGQDRRAGRREGCGRHRVARRRPRGGPGVPVGRGLRRRRAHGRHRGGPHRARAVAARRCATASPTARAAGARPRTSSGSATTTRARTPAGWAPTRRSPCRPSPSSTSSWTGRSRPTLAALAPPAASTYRGVLYAGIMLTPAGPKILEYNVRFGDPECQVVVPRLASDLAGHLREAADGQARRPRSVERRRLRHRRARRRGLPGRAPHRRRHHRPGRRPAQSTGVTVFHAGTGPADDGGIVTAGGRVLNVTATGADPAPRRGDRAYDGGGRDLRGRACTTAPTSPWSVRPVIPRYSLPEMAALFTDEAKFAHLARGRDPRRGGLGRARRRPARRRRRRPGAGRLRRRRHRGARAHHRARRGRLRRRRAGAGRPAGRRLGPLRPDVVATSSTPPSPSP